jgi:hypothetical protein
MSYSCGLSNGGAPHLKPYIAPKFTISMSDVIRVDLKPTVMSSRNLIENEYQLFLGLLTKACSPEGTGYTELDTPGYSRQAVHFIGEPRHALRSVTGATFAFDYDVATHVQQVAAFDQQGRVVAYCRPANVAGAKGLLGSVIIRPHDLVLSRR